MRFLIVLLICLFLSLPASWGQSCDGVDASESQPLQSVAEEHDAGSCHVHATDQGYLLSDPNCTPGAINPSATLDVLKKIKTFCLRNHVTPESQKAGTYKWYSITHPTNNQGATQSYELDHLIPPYLGGADTLDKVWPQCG